MKQRNTAIDFFKLIFSLCIIGVHLDLFKDASIPAYRILTQSVFRIGVPFYFISSGYFFADKLNDTGRSDAWLLRLLKIYIVFEILDIILTMLVPRIHYPFGYVVLRVFTTGLNRIYWYLISLILTCFLLRKLWKKGYAVQLIAAGLFLYMITMTYDTYSFLFENSLMSKLGEFHKAVWAWPQGGFGESVLYLSVGVYLRQNQPKIRYVNLLLCISLVLLITEGWFCQAHGALDANCYFTLIPSSVLIFQYALDHPDILRIPKAGEISLYVYMIHMYYSFVSYAFSQNSFPRFLITAVLSLLTSALIVWIKERAAMRIV